MKWFWIIAGRVFVLLMFVGMFLVDLLIFPVLLFKFIQNKTKPKGKIL